MSTLRSGTAAALPWRTREATRHLLLAATTSLGVTAATGLGLLAGPDNDNLVALLLLPHLAAGVLALILFTPFVIIHWRDGREPLVHLLLPFRLLLAPPGTPFLRQRLLGHLLLWSLALVLLSGVLSLVPALAYLLGTPFTLPYGTQDMLMQGHRWLSLPLAGSALLHYPRTARR